MASFEDIVSYLKGGLPNVNIVTLNSNYVGRYDVRHPASTLLWGQYTRTRR